MFIFGGSRVRKRTEEWLVDRMARTNECVRIHFS